MLYINNPEALVAMETERRKELGLDLTTYESPAPRGNAASRRTRDYRLRTATTRYAG